MSEGGRFTEKGGNSSYGTKFDGVISAASVGRYRSVLEPEQVRVVQLFASRDMARLGYERDPTACSRTQHLRFALAALPLELVRFVAWHIREATRGARGRPVPSYRLEPAGASG
jgi:hypothetical protein